MYFWPVDVSLPPPPGLTWHRPHGNFVCAANCGVASARGGGPLSAQLPRPRSLRERPWPQLQQSTSSIRKCSNFGGAHSHLLIVARLLRASSPDACSSQLQFSGVMEQLSKTDATCRPSKMSYSGQSTRRLSSTRQNAASLTRRTSFICGYCSLTKDGHARGSRLVGLAENAVQHRKLRGTLPQREHAQ